MKKVLLHDNHSFLVKDEDVNFFNNYLDQVKVVANLFNCSVDSGSYNETNSCFLDLNSDKVCLSLNFYRSSNGGLRKMNLFNQKGSTLYSSVDMSYKYLFEKAISLIG